MSDGSTQQAQPNLAPVSEGGQSLNLGQGAEAINGLNLFGDEDQTGPADNNPQAESEEQLASEESDGNLETEESESEDTDQESNDDQRAEDSNTDDDEGEQAEIESLAQLVEALEADNSFLDGLTDTFTADGEEVTVSLQELRRGYQRDANYRRQTTELANQRRTLEQEHQTALQNVQKEVVQVGQVLQQGEQMLVGELNTAEMQQLRSTNPAEWAARREEIGQRIQGIRALYQNASQQYDAYQQQQTQQNHQQMQELRETQLNNLRNELPDWGDDLKGRIVGYLNDSVGFSQDDLSQVFDSRLIVLANKARMYDDMQKVSKETKKKVVNLPKVQKPGKGGKPGPSKQNVNIARATKKLKQGGGKVRDAADLIGLKIKDL